MKKTVFLLALLASALSSAAQLNNAGFEDWQTNTQGNLYLTGWRHEVSGDTENQLFIGTYRETNSQQGNYALKLSRWYNYTWDQARQKTAIGYKPQLLNGYYTYTEADLTGGKDTAIVQVFLTRWNSITHQPDTVGLGEAVLTETATYSAFNCAINYSSSQMPDSVMVLIKPTHANGVCSGNSWCSYLTIDNLSLSGVNSAADNAHTEDQVTIYPNPAGRHFTVQLNSGISDQNFGLELTDTQGRLVWKKEFAAYQGRLFQVPIGQFTKGIYTVRLQTPNQVIVKRLAVQ